MGVSGSVPCSLRRPSHKAHWQTWDRARLRRWSVDVRVIVNLGHKGWFSEDGETRESGIREDRPTQGGLILPDAREQNDVAILSVLKGELGPPHGQRRRIMGADNKVSRHALAFVWVAQPSEAQGLTPLDEFRSRDDASYEERVRRDRHAKANTLKNRFSDGGTWIVIG